MDFSWSSIFRQCWGGSQDPKRYCLGPGCGWRGFEARRRGEVSGGGSPFAPRRSLAPPCGRGAQPVWPAPSRRGEGRVASGEGGQGAVRPADPRPGHRAGPGVPAGGGSPGSPPGPPGRGHTPTRLSPTTGPREATREARGAPKRRVRGAGAPSAPTPGAPVPPRTPQQAQLEQPPRPRSRGAADESRLRVRAARCPALAPPGLAGPPVPRRRLPVGHSWTEVSPSLPRPPGPLAPTSSGPRRDLPWPFTFQGPRRLGCRPSLQGQKVGVTAQPASSSGFGAPPSPPASVCPSAQWV